MSLPTNPHICMVVGGANERGGVERHLFDLSKELTNSFTVSIIADHSYDAFFDPTVHFLAVPFVKWRFNPTLLVAVRRELARIQPDLIHVHGKKAAQVVVAACPLAKQPRVMTLHNPKPAIRLVRSMDAVIAVSGEVAKTVSGLAKPCYVIPNGRG